MATTQMRRQMGGQAVETEQTDDRAFRVVLKHARGGRRIATWEGEAESAEDAFEAAMERHDPIGHEIVGVVTDEDGDGDVFRAAGRTADPRELDALGLSDVFDHADTPSLDDEWPWGREY